MEDLGDGFFGTDDQVKLISVTIDLPDNDTIGGNTDELLSFKGLESDSAGNYIYEVKDLKRH